MGKYPEFSLSRVVSLWFTLQVADPGEGFKETVFKIRSVHSDEETFTENTT